MSLLFSESIRTQQELPSFVPAFFQPCDLVRYVIFEVLHFQSPLPPAVERQCSENWI